jgi:hypothetical protein
MYIYKFWVWSATEADQTWRTSTRIYSKLYLYLFPKFNLALLTFPALRRLNFLLSTSESCRAENDVSFKRSPFKEIVPDPRAFPFLVSHK